MKTSVDAVLHYNQKYNYNGLLNYKAQIMIAI